MVIVTHDRLRLCLSACSRGVQILPGRRQFVLVTVWQSGCASWPGGIVFCEGASAHNPERHASQAGRSLLSTEFRPAFVG